MFVDEFWDHLKLLFSNTDHDLLKIHKYFLNIGYYTADMLSNVSHSTNHFWYFY